MAAAAAKSVASLVKGVVYVKRLFSIYPKRQNIMSLAIVYSYFWPLCSWSLFRHGLNRTRGYTPGDVLGSILVIFDIQFWVRHTLHGENIPVLYG